MGALRYIGRGWVFDDLEEATKISLSQHQRFLVDFLEIGSTVWYDKWVRHPSTAEEANKHCHEYTMAGFPGCLGSTDATHVVHLGIPAWLREVQSSHKEGHPARTYNCTVNHRRMALFCTEGHPCTYNDKHLIKLDQFVNGMQVGKIYQTGLSSFTPGMKGTLSSKSGRGATCWLTMAIYLFGRLRFHLMSAVGPTNSECPPPIPPPLPSVPNPLILFSNLPSAPPDTFSRNAWSRCGKTANVFLVH